ncbi:hypothetical protein FEK35_29320 [Nocardia cyriacigeorgica]|uniref:DUF4352 domain-containing protein n=1 Tax=Nocardia cyriacigeorgica TaxID=135487 RepID=A0A5R8P5F3_9NOCA|nr:hypothetical protein [Nocardia cyriacigeorgica]TLF93677.1 hypothetical protein FEK35_29320 [Nocardia cyriacigeorgica]
MNPRKLTIAIAIAIAIAAAGIGAGLLGCSDETTSKPADPGSWVTSQQQDAEEATVPDITTVTMGETVEVENDKGRAKITLSNYGPRVSEIWDESQAALVSIEVLEGVYSYNALYFEAETVDHFRLTDEIQDDPELQSGDLRAGQKLQGWIGYQPAPGQVIQSIHLTDALGDTVAIWTVQ